MTVYNRSRQDSQWMNAIAYILAGWCTAFGLINMWLYTEERLLHAFPVFAWALGGITYSVGGVIYALKIPERLVPKKLDLFLQSHNVFHWMILFAAILHVWASIRAFHERQLFPCPEAGRFETSPGHFTATSNIWSRPFRIQTSNLRLDNVRKTTSKIRGKLMKIIIKQHTSILNDVT